MALYPARNKFQVPFSISGSASALNGATYNILSFESSSGLIVVPSFAKSIRIGASILFTTNPVAQTFALRVIHYGTGTAGSPIGSTVTQTVTCTPESNNGSNSWRFELTMASPLLLSSGAQAVADRVGFWTLAPTIVNNSGGTLVTVAGVWSRGLLVFEA